MKKEIYVINAYRFGEREKHSYTVAIFDKKDKAIKCAENHANYRGGKYSCVVEQCNLNDFSNDYDNYTKEIFRTKHSLE